MIYPLFFAQVSSPPPEIIQPTEVRPLPESLDNVPVFNSNSPELVLNEGILLSTFSPINKAYPNAHLNYAFLGRFDIFAHHVAKGVIPDDLQTLYLGILVHNLEDYPVTVQILQGSTYLSQPDAPFIELPSQVEVSDQEVFAGPGSRVMGDILRDRRLSVFPDKIMIPPNQSRLLLNAGIPVKNLDPPLNGRSTYLRLRSDGRVAIASLAQKADTPPTLTQWERLLQTGDLVTPRDRPPTPLETSGNLIYGRVAGVSLGSQWNTRLRDIGTLDLTVPPVGQAIAYGLSTLIGGRLGTQQVQSARMLVRYPDTAYQAHGNYGVHYRLILPLYNPTANRQQIAIALQTPLKQDHVDEGLRFLNPPNKAVFFRGMVSIHAPDNQENYQTRYFHLVQRQGEQSEPLMTLTLAPQERKLVRVELIYPPDATPPQVLTLKQLPSP